MNDSNHLIIAENSFLDQIEKKAKIAIHAKIYDKKIPLFSILNSSYFPSRSLLLHLTRRSPQVKTVHLLL